MQLFRRMTAAVIAALGGMSAPAVASEMCPAEQAAVQMPADPALCAQLDPVVRRPAALPLDQYEAKLGLFLRNFCHRRADAGWAVDKTVRDTGPFTAELSGGKWVGTYHGTHAPVIVWYSPEMIAWLHTHRPAGGAPVGGDVPRGDVPGGGVPGGGVPDGAMMVKEMYPAPASACRDIPVDHLLPTSGAAVMVRDRAASQDGWFWGWFGWGDWQPDWPPPSGNGVANMGFGQYCTNCHASARDNSTFASLGNIKGEPGSFLNFLSQDFFMGTGAQARTEFAPVLNHPLVEHHEAVALEEEKPRPASLPPVQRGGDVFAGLGLGRLPVPARQAVARMPSATYDSVPVAAGTLTAHSQFVTSDQCLGCHSAGGTGLQFDMTEPGSDGTLLNLSEYGTWRYTPMGLAGRDPIFFAQLASETQSFHPTIGPLVQNTCLGCHGIMGQRQFGIDASDAHGSCPTFLRDALDAAPWPDGNPAAHLARYGALGRDGISCAACHHMALGEAAATRFRDAPQNRCVAERRNLLNPHATGTAATFTGSFLVGAPDRLAGPFDDPKTMPMRHALGMVPEHDSSIASSELCGACHTVHLPILRAGQTLGYTFEQSTYAEWAFSAYRTGTTPDGALPFGAGSRAQSCQGCHMPSTDAAGAPYRSRIAGIQQVSNFPAVENALPASDLDLPVRQGYAEHLLVGLNLFVVEMARQFADVLGISTQDPMLARRGAAPTLVTERAILDQALHASATIAVSQVSTNAGTLAATVTVRNTTGHRFPSGVAFRRAFIEFDVLDASGQVIWASGRTNDAGVLIDASGQPIAGEYWWTSDCSARIEPDKRLHQPNYRVIDRQDEAQIFEELAAGPATDGPAQCGPDAPPAGPLTTSFLSICARVKDNRLLPTGFMSRPQRVAIAHALGSDDSLADDAGPVGVSDDPDFRDDGSAAVTYRVGLAGLPAHPASVVATLYDQAVAPYFLQDRLCTSAGEDQRRLAFIAGGLDLAGGPAADWKLKMVSTGAVPVMP
jgi:hypothetical protein